MSKAGRELKVISDNKKGKGAAKTDGPSEIIGLKDSKTQPEKKDGKVAGSGKIPLNVDVKENQLLNKLKEPAASRAGSILVHATTKPESLMTAVEKMEATRKGISKLELEELKKRAGLDYDQLSRILQVARATLIAKKGTDKFPPLLSEKIMSLADIYSYGYEVFGNEPEFNKWIFQPVAALGGKSPYEILDNVYGREEVKHIIGRIEYGVYS